MSRPSRFGVRYLDAKLEDALKRKHGDVWEDLIDPSMYSVRDFDDRRLAVAFAENRTDGQAFERRNIREVPSMDPEGFDGWAWDEVDFYDESNEASS